MPTQVQGLGLVDDQGNKSIVVNLSNARQMTNTEYQQLTPAQRNGAIIVTDFPIPEDDDKVEVTADGVKTYAELFNELFTDTNFLKITENSVLEIQDVNTAYFLANLGRIDRVSKNAIYTRANVSSGGARVFYYYISSASAYYIAVGATAEVDHSTDKPANGTKITLYYGNKLAVVDMEVDADNVPYDNTSSGLVATDAQGAIDELQSDKASNDDINPYIKSKISTTSVLPGNTLTFSLPVNPDILYEFKAMIANANDSAIASIIAIRTASKVIHSKLTTNDATSYSYEDGKLIITLSSNYWLYSLRQINDEI